LRRILLFAAATLIAAAPATVRAQAREVTGKVTQVGTGTPIADVTVGILGQQLGVRTNERGEYRFRVPAGDVAIMARAIGFKRVTIRLTASQSTADFELEKDILELEGVTVTGQATTVDKRNASTAIASVSAEELMKSPSKSIEGNLAGKIVGASIFENSGVPGGGMQVQIRGATSILGQGDPLYVVDGVMVSNASVSGGLASISRSTGTTASSQDQTVNRLADLNPNDVESIEVLKSAAATAIYGSRATNGVVVITTKKGKAGTTRYNITQRVGQSNVTRLLGSRQFNCYTATATCTNAVQPWLGPSPQADSVARANCTPVCPLYPWQNWTYDNPGQAWETVLSASGGTGSSRFFASLNDRQTPGTEINSGARRTSGRLNLDQTIGDKFTIAGGIDVTHNFVQNGLGNNDNAGISPIYTYGYAPAIYDIRKIDPTTGRVINMFMNGGGSGTSNPLAIIPALTNNEDTWRQTANVRVGYNLFSTAHNTVQLSYIGGVDRYQLEGTQFSPGYLQFESADGFLGTSQVTSADSRFINQSANGVWTFSPSWKWFNSAQTSFGGTYETQYTNTYNLRARGLLPTRIVPNFTGSTDFAAAETINEFRDQSMYVNEQIIALDEKLSLAVGVREDRGSENGDRNKFYTYPKFAASYRFVNPLSFVTSKSGVDEIKLRASFGQAGNRPNYGLRDITIASGGIIGGVGSLVASTTLGNPAIQPEVMNEQEYGIDASFFKGRAFLEASHYERVIKELLVTFPLPNSSGLSSQTINGGQMSTRGFEAGLTLVPISKRDLEWTFRTTFQANVQFVDQLPVPAFNVANSFGVAYGGNRIDQGTRPTMIWGNLQYSCVNTTVNGAVVVGTGADNKPCHRMAPGEVVAKSVVRDSMIADANPRAQTQFLNTVTWKSLSFTALVDWRNGGYTSDMTKNLFDEGGNSHDYDNPSPVAGTPLGAYRYQVWSGNNISTYIDDGTYVKLREVTVTWTAPKRWADLAKAREMRISFQGRNLAMWTKYWSFDPEFNNFGNQNFNRFIDLAPYPSMKQFFFSIDLGY